MKTNVLIRWVLCAGLWACVAPDVAPAPLAKRTIFGERDKP